jgi:hypothetical protein
MPLYKFGSLVTARSSVVAEDADDKDFGRLSRNGQNLARNCQDVVGEGTWQQEPLDFCPHLSYISEYSSCTSENSCSGDQNDESP